ncbi:hypothetical protein KW807_01885, partial [Candidatus Parcubacteria bacterium]|nr:hypothetical protein [Candidatus Parcubacteria bacterium]
RRSKYGFLESNEYGDDLYGTPVEEIKGKGVVICEVDCNGASQIRKKFHNTLSVFILPPNYQELERRLYGRKKDSPASIARRLAIATAEIQEVEKFTCWIVNADLGVAAKDLWTFLINANLSRRKFPSPDFRDEVRLEAIRATFPLAMV